jgi:hypothetical protein
VKRYTFQFGILNAEGCIGYLAHPFSKLTTTSSPLTYFLATWNSMEEEAGGVGLSVVF